MARRLVVALLSTVILSVVLAYLYSTIKIFLIITGYAFLLGGIPTSMLIDKIIRKEPLKLTCYLISGFVLGVITIIIFSLLIGGGSLNLSILTFGIFGAIGSFIFYSLLSLLQNLGKRFN